MTNNEDEFVTITKQYLKELEYDVRVLEALYAGGVGDWVWYGESLKALFNEEDEE